MTNFDAKSAFVGACFTAAVFFLGAASRPTVEAEVDTVTEDLSVSQRQSSTNQTITHKGEITIVLKNEKGFAVVSPFRIKLED